MSFPPSAQPPETQQLPPNVWLMHGRPLMLGGPQGQMQNDVIATSAREQQSLPPQAKQYAQSVVMQPYPAFSAQQIQAQGSDPGKRECCIFAPFLACASDKPQDNTNCFNAEYALREPKLTSTSDIFILQFLLSSLLRYSCWIVVCI
jgi:hypothetical protein